MYYVIVDIISNYVSIIPQIKEKDKMQLVITGIDLTK
jgi:hypothetical protein